jgi:hypothetical protein
MDFEILPEELTHLSARALMVDAQDRVWVGTDHGFIDMRDVDGRWKATEARAALVRQRAGLFGGMAVPGLVLAIIMPFVEQDWCREAL